MLRVPTATQLGTLSRKCFTSTPTKKAFQSYLATTSSSKTSAILQIQTQRCLSQRGLHQLIKSRIQVRNVNTKSNAHVHVRTSRRQNSTTTKTNTTKNNKNKTKTETRSSRTKRLIFLFKMTRIPVLVVAVYQLGYQQGIIDFSRDPVEKRYELLYSILSGIEASGHQVTSGEQMTRVPKTVISAAKQHVMNQLLECIFKYVQKEPELVDGVRSCQRILQLTESLVPGQPISSATQNPAEIRIIETLRNDEEFARWKDANLRMGRGSVDWHMFVIESDIPNAFVSELIPRTIFITQAMLDKVVSNEDEMALLLGHELSHMILGHNSEQNSFHVWLSTFEIVLLSLDPTEGFVSLAIMTLIRTVKSSFIAALSRDNENEADALGMKLTAMSCFDTERAAEIFRKIAEQEQESMGIRKRSDEAGESQKFKEFMNMNSHPPSMERYENLKRLSETENASKYSSSYCRNLWGSFMAAVKRDSGRYSRFDYTCIKH